MKTLFSYLKGFLTRRQNRKIVAGIMRVEMQNDRTNMVPVHMPTLGPYHDKNPKVCLKCKKQLEGIPTMEACYGG